MGLENDDQLVETGSWTRGNESVDWELYASSSLPNAEDTTAVFCVAITSDQKILLEREERGWGLLGGHIDEGERIEDALTRECLEEGGFKPRNPALFGYRKMTATKPVAHPEPDRVYPFPVSYIAYYWATTDDLILPHSEPNVLEVKAFTIDDISNLNSVDSSVIAVGWDLYVKSRGIHK